MAHNSYRKFKNHCAFCSNILTKKNRTAEHLFGKKIQNIHPVKYHLKFHDQDGKKENGSSPITHLKSRSVCKTCNEGWMSLEIDRVYPVLKKLIKGEKGKISIESAKLLRRYFIRLAVLVDIESSSHELSESVLTEKYILKFGTSNKYSSIITQGERENFKNGSEIQRIFVYIGHHEGILGLDPLMNHAPLFGINYEENEGLILIQKTFTIVIGELTFVISIGGKFCKYKILEKNSPFIALENSQFLWPPCLKVSYLDVYETFSEDKYKCESISAIKNMSTQELLSQEARIRYQYNDSLKQ